MIKNFSPGALGINGRQSELIELALTYAFSGMDVDMSEMLRRAQRTSVEDANKYLAAAKKITVGGFGLDVDLDADDATFTTHVASLHPLAELAKELNVYRCYIKLPPATDRLPYHEYFDTQRDRIAQIADALAPRGIKLGVGFSAGKDLGEKQEFSFVRNVEGLVALVNAVAADNVGFIIDTWDWVVGDGAMDQISEIPGSKVVSVILSSVAPDVDPGSAQSADRVLPELEGALGHVKLVKHLSESGFDGPVSPGASSSQYKGQTRESTVQKAQEAIDGIFKEAGLPVSPLPMDLIEDIPYEPNPVQ